MISAYAIQRDHGTRPDRAMRMTGVLTAPSEKVSAQSGTRRCRLDTAGLFHWRPGLKVPNRGITVGSFDRAPNLSRLRGGDYLDRGDDVLQCSDLVKGAPGRHSLMLGHRHRRSARCCAFRRSRRALSLSGMGGLCSPSLSDASHRVPLLSPGAAPAATGRLRCAAPHRFAGAASRARPGPPGHRRMTELHQARNSEASRHATDRPPPRARTP